MAKINKFNSLSFIFLFNQLQATTPECCFAQFLPVFKAALAFFYCAYYLRIFSWMFCGEITTNRRRLYRFRVFKIAELKTSQTRSFRGKFAKHGNKKNNSFINIISYNSANAAEMSGPEMSVADILRNVYIDRINNGNVKILITRVQDS